MLDKILVIVATIKLASGVANISLPRTSVRGTLNQIELYYYYYKIKLEFFELYELKLHKLRIV